MDNKPLRIILLLAILYHPIMRFIENKKNERLNEQPKIPTNEHSYKHIDDNYKKTIEQIIESRTQHVSPEMIFKLRDYPEQCRLSLSVLKSQEIQNWQDSATKDEMQRTILFLQKDCQHFSPSTTHQATTHGE